VNVLDLVSVHTYLSVWVFVVHKRVFVVQKNMSIAANMKGDGDIKVHAMYALGLKAYIARTFKPLQPLIFGSIAKF